MPNFITARVTKVPIYYNTSLVVIRYNANLRVGLLETLVFEASTYEYFVIHMCEVRAFVHILLISSFIFVNFLVFVN